VTARVTIVTSIEPGSRAQFSLNSRSILHIASQEYRLPRLSMSSVVSMSSVDGDLIRDELQAICRVSVSLTTAPLCLSCFEALSKRLDGVTIECFSGSLNVKVELSKRLELFPVFRF
jgi:hypothetical protein